MTYFASTHKTADRIVGLYVSRQFLAYIVCGTIATMAHLFARYALSFYFSFSNSVLIAYFIGMLAALFLYRSFVFNAGAGSLTRQAFLFVLAYLAFLPMTWGLSVALERPLLTIFAPGAAHLGAHLVGVGVPVVLNFAFNKLVTFREAIPAGHPDRRAQSARIVPPHPKGEGSRRRTAALALLGLLSLYAVSLAVVGISGDFPLNDDWAYAITTREFVRTGVFTPSSWSAIPLIVEVLFAAPFCLASHCGSDDLRVATIVASALLFATTFLLVRLGTRNLVISILAAASIAFNPVAYALSFTFMSDVLFAALMAAGTAVFIRSLQRESVPLAVLGTAVALAATLTRQLGLCLPLAYLAVCIVQMAGAGTWRSRAIPALLPLMACGGALVGLRQWLRVAGRLPALFDVKSSDLLETLRSPLLTLVRVGHNASTILLYMGLFALPVLLVTRAASRRRATANPWVRRVPVVAAFGGTALAAGDLLALHRLMPSGGNILTPQGVGPLLLRDVSVLGLPGVPPLPSAFWLLVTLLSLLGAFLLVERIVARMLDLVLDIAAPPRHWQLRPARIAELFALTAALAYVTPLLLISFYDRYLIPLLPLTLFLLGSGTPRMDLRRWRTGLATAMCLLISAYAVLAVHDYMAWNRARWAAIAELETSKGLDATRIDGGMEYNGLRAYRPDYATKDGKSWWWVDDDDYQIAFGHIEGTKVIGLYPYRTLLPPAEPSIKVLVKAR